MLVAQLYCGSLYHAVRIRFVARLCHQTAQTLHVLLCPVCSALCVLRHASIQFVCGSCESVVRVSTLCDVYVSQYARLYQVDIGRFRATPRVSLPIASSDAICVHVTRRVVSQVVCTFPPRFWYQAVLGGLRIPRRVWILEFIVPDLRRQDALGALQGSIGSASP